MSGPGGWARLGLVALLVAVPGSINLSITVLPFLMALGWIGSRRVRAPRREAP